MTKRFLASITVLLLGASLAGCAASEAQSTPAVGIGADTVLIDVRSPQEFAQGHLEGAININVESADFGAAIGQLSPDQEYLVYCRSGRRSGIAINQMQAMGLSAVNLGSVQEASVATGVPVTQ